MLNQNTVNTRSQLQTYAILAMVLSVLTGILLTFAVPSANSYAAALILLVLGMAFSGGLITLIVSFILRYTHRTK